MTIQGIDVSVYQPTGDWTKVPGISFAVARATLGSSYVDPTYSAHLAGAKSAGLLPGAYHYLTPGSGSIQCDAFLRAIKDPTGLIIQLDCEAKGLAYADIVDFTERWNIQTAGHPEFIYCNQPFWAHLGNPDMKSLGPWWLAAYPGGSGYPGDSSPQWNEIAGGNKPTIWQWGPIHLAGFPKPVDGDAYRGTRDELAVYTHPPAAGPAEPAMSYNFTIDPTKPTGSLLVSASSHSYLDLATGATHPIPAGTNYTRAVPGRLDHPIPGNFPGDRQSAFLVAPAGSLTAVLATDGVFTPSNPAVDCTAAVEAATAPLEAKIAEAQKVLA